MNEWIARYEEGYVRSDGDRVRLTSELHEQHPWKTPEAARAHWHTRPDLVGPDVTPYKNGLEQLVSVAAHPGFSEVDVIAIWRRVTFLRRASHAAGTTTNEELPAR